MSSFELELPEPPPHPLVGRRVDGPDGRSIGTVIEVYLDHPSEEDEWALVELASAHCNGCFTVGTPESRFVPIEGLRADADRLVSRWPVEVVEAAPVEPTDTALTRVEEDELYAHYGMEYPRQWINSGLPGGAVVVGVAGVAADSERLAGTTVY